MKKAFPFCSVVVLGVIAFAGCGPSRNPTADHRDCLSTMGEETAAHLREKKIPLKGADAELYGNKDQQVYLLSSQEPVKVSAEGAAKNPVAIIEHKDARGKSSFYLIEQEIGTEKITFTLSKDEKVLESVTVPFVLSRATTPHPGGECLKYCAGIEANNDAQLAALLAQANQTCMKLRICLPFCSCVSGVPYVGYALYLITPTSWRCWKVLATEKQLSLAWGLPDAGPFLDQAFDTALRKAARLYTD
jgi:hypothetical protein